MRNLELGECIGDITAVSVRIIFVACWSSDVPGIPFQRLHYYFDVHRAVLGAEEANSMTTVRDPCRNRITRTATLTLGALTLVVV